MYVEWYIYTSNWTRREREKNKESTGRVHSESTGTTRVQYRTVENKYYQYYIQHTELQVLVLPEYSSKKTF
jgi:hypothetical protein